MTYREARRAGLNPRYRKLKTDLQHAGGCYPRMRAGTMVLVTDARNQPRWEEDQKVFVAQPGCGCEILLSLAFERDQGHINP